MSLQAPQSGIKLLVVDDDRAVRSLVLQMATNWDYIAEESPNAEDALKRLEKTRFNIVLTDIRMDKMDGVTFASKIRETMPSTAVIIMTGFPSTKTVQKSQDIGAIYYMQKPVKREELGDTLKIAASWNIGMLVDRAGRRFLALKKGEERERENRLKSIKFEIQRFLRMPGNMPALREFVYSANVENNALYSELKDKFSTDSVKPF